MISPILYWLVVCMPTHLSINASINAQQINTSICSTLQHINCSTLQHINTSIQHESSLAPTFDQGGNEYEKRGTKNILSEEA